MSWPSQDISSANNALSGNIDGKNATFTFQVYSDRVKVFKNGIKMTQGVDVYVGRLSVTFSPAQIPQQGDILTLEVYP